MTPKTTLFNDQTGLARLHLGKCSFTFWKINKVILVLLFSFDTVIKLNWIHFIDTDDAGKLEIKLMFLLIQVWELSDDGK